MKGNKIYNNEKLRQEIANNPILNKYIDTTIKIPFDDLNSAQSFTPIQYVNKYGKEVSEIRAKTRISYNISKLPANHFGSVYDYSIDTLPKYFVRVKGTEITFISNENFRWQNKFLLNRRFASKILSFWAYLHDIRYKPSEGKESAIDMWCIPIKHLGSKKVIHLISIKEVRELLKDIINEIRNHNPKAYYEYEIEVNEPQKSDIIVGEETPDGNIKLVKNKYIRRWSFPKYNVNYLLKLLDILNSGEILDMAACFLS